MRVIDLFDRGAMLAPDAPCLKDDARTISYREARKATHAIARALNRLGIGPGDRVAVITPNDAWGYVACLGLGRAEAVWVPLNPRSTFEENLGNLDLTEPKLLIYLERFLAEQLAAVSSSASCRDSTEPLSWEEHCRARNLV